MLPGPVFNVELLTLSRRGRYYLFRLLYGAILLALVWMNDPALAYRYPPRDPNQEISLQEMASIGYSIFGGLVWIQSLAILFLTPALVAGVIADERQRKTLHYLLASCLSSSEIVIGKLAARLLFTTVFLGLGLPIFVMLSFLGGVDPQLVLLFFAASATTLFFLGALSIAVSTHARRPREAVSLTYILELFWFLGPPLLTQFFPWLGGYWQDAYQLVKPVNEWVATSSPFYLLFSLMRSTAVIEPILWMMGVQVLFGAGLMLIAVLRLRPVARAEGGTTRTASRTLRFFRRRDCGDDGMIWKECFVTKTSFINQIATTLVFLLVTGLMIYFSYELIGAAFQELLSEGYWGPRHVARQDLNFALRTIMTLLYLCMAIGIASSASNSLSSEREQDTWISLVSTPLTALEILRAKMMGAIWSMRWVIGLWLFFGFSGLLLGSIHPIGFMAGFALLVIYSGFICALGTFFSLKARSSARALTSTLGTLLLLNGVYLIVNIPLRIDSPIIYFGVSPLFEAASLCTSQELYQFFEFRSRSYGPSDWELVFAALLTVFFYGGSAVGLFYFALTRFDSESDRPTSPTFDARPVKPKPFDVDLDPVAVGSSRDVTEIETPEHEPIPPNDRGDGP